MIALDVLALRASKVAADAVVPFTVNVYAFSSPSLKAEFKFSAVPAAIVAVTTPFVSSAIKFAIVAEIEPVIFTSAFAAIPNASVTFFALSPTAIVFSIRSFELISIIQVLLAPMILYLFSPKFKYIGVGIVLRYSFKIFVLER